MLHDLERCKNDLLTSSGSEVQYGRRVLASGKTVCIFELRSRYKISVHASCDCSLLHQQLLVRGRHEEGSIQTSIVYKTHKVSTATGYSSD